MSSQIHEISNQQDQQVKLFHLIQLQKKLELSNKKHPIARKTIGRMNNPPRKKEMISFG